MRSAAVPARVVHASGPWSTCDGSRTADDRRVMGCAAQTIDVWSFAIDGSLAAPETLDRVERARFQRMRSESKRLEFLVGRSMLRRILGEHLDVHASAVRLDYGAHGKPRLLRSGPAFNLSHSGRRAVVAIAASGRVGVDVEHCRPRRPFRRLSRRFFSQAEDRWLCALPGPDRAEGFYRVWTLKESYLKSDRDRAHLPVGRFRSRPGAQAASFTGHRLPGRCARPVALCDSRASRRLRGCAVLGRKGAARSSSRDLGVGVVLRQVSSATSYTLDIAAYLEGT